MVLDQAAKVQEPVEVKDQVEMVRVVEDEKDKVLAAVVEEVKAAVKEQEKVAAVGRAEVAVRTDTASGTYGYNS